MPRYKITLEYDGTPFCGWQRQKDALSVQEVLEKALFVLEKSPVSTFASGRTDAGVHARGQVVHFDLKKSYDLYKLRESLNALMRPNPISVLQIEEVSDDFHARFDARERTYLYRILNRPAPSVLDALRVWHFPSPLDVEAMQQAANLLIGRHDFSTFRAAGCQAKSPIKTMNSITLQKEGDMINITLKARSFIHHQVRNIVGTLILVGSHKWSVEDFKTAFEAKDRRKGGVTAPACGLFFISVHYPKKD
ncbi:MAG: tRNA pseudouridine(38-40) synthase TruA [Alphaproteobacteria bacterium]|nr:tRNA pseudouridine(38-40) synthase TruA [Alphaproteobacteria bacterium]